jgi:hypothetical protein
MIKRMKCIRWGGGGEGMACLRGSQAEKPHKSTVLPTPANIFSAKVGQNVKRSNHRDRKIRRKD